LRMKRPASGWFDGPSQLTVKDETGSVVADVEVDPIGKFHRTESGAVFAHVLGRFVPGAGYARIRAMLDEFQAAYDARDEPLAVALHERIDRLGLTATDPEGTTYHVFNVYFQQGALLFAATA
jgi:hypothetical protein